MDYNIQVRKAVILASGYGRRMRQKEVFPSKPMRQIENKPLISYVIDLLISSGIEKIYIVYHSVTSDVLDLLKYSAAYAEYLEFIEEDEQKGTLLSFSRIKNMLSPPFLMVFEDIIADKKDFIDMLNIGHQYIAGKADLVIQTVRSPSLISEQAFLIENGRIIRYQKNGIIGAVNSFQEKQYGGMVYLWISEPFSLIEPYFAKQNYKFSSFLEEYIPKHVVFEMPINDMWDVDTPEAADLTKEIFRERGGWDGCLE